MKFYKDDFNKLSFCDFDVIEMNLEKNTTTMYIKLQGAFYKIENKIEILNNVIIKIYFWKSISITFPSKNKVIFLNEKNYDPLTEICEAKQMGDELIFSGFGKNTNLWVEYKFISAQVEIAFENSEDKEIEILKRRKLFRLSKLACDLLRSDLLVGSENKLECDKDGWVSVTEFLHALHLRNNEWGSLSEKDLIEMIKLFHYPIFEMKKDKIRAIGSPRIHELLTGSLKKLISEPAKSLLTPSHPEAMVGIRFYEGVINKSLILSEVFRIKVEIDNRRHSVKLYLSNINDIHSGNMNESVPIKFLCWFLVSSRVYEGKRFRLIKNNKYIGEGIFKKIKAG